MFDDTDAGGEGVACIDGAREPMMRAGVVGADAGGGASCCCRTLSPMPKVMRHGLIAVGSALWFAGLWSQFHSLSTAATYVALSLLMALVVVF